MHRAIQLPTGPYPGWELGEPPPEGTDLKSVPDRLALFLVYRRYPTSAKAHSLQSCCVTVLETM